MVRVLRREEIRFLILETLMVVVGVLAALFLDRVREDAENERTVAAARARLVTEVEQNREELQELVKVVSSRLDLLLQQRAEIPPGTSLAELVGEFGGFRTADFSDAAWDRLSRSYLGEMADADLLRDAFYLYEWNGQFEDLNGKISDLVFSELFFSPERAGAASDIAERIMRQQLSWAKDLIPRYDDFLAAYPTQ